MTETELFWVKVGAFSQVAGAIATFLAVAASLFIALRTRRPRLRLKVGERLITNGADDWPRYVMFEIANAGERPVHIKGIGWKTGWLRWGPQCLRTKAAVQMPLLTGLGQDPPYELQAGASASSFQPMEAMRAGAVERDEPFFARDWPVWGRRATRIRAYAYTADGYTIRAKPEKPLRRQLAQFDLEAGNTGNLVYDCTQSG